MISMEALFWAPLGLDLMLLAITYSYCRFSGLEWYLNTTMPKGKKNDDEAIIKSIKDKSNPIHSVWDLAMIAYSAYGCLLPWAAYISYVDPTHRTSCAWAMTSLMAMKLLSEGAWNWKDGEQRSKIITIVVFYLPTYGGYAIYNTFFK